MLCTYDIWEMVDIIYWVKYKSTLENSPIIKNRLKQDSEGSLIVCAADKIHNLQSMIDAYTVQGVALFEKFNSSPNKKLWFYSEVLKILKLKLKNKIVDELDVVYNKAFSELLQN